VRTVAGLTTGLKVSAKSDTGALCESLKNPARLVPFQSAISGELMLEDLLSSDNIGLAGTRHQVPSVILQ
jgi:hypothetical protein